MLTLIICTYNRDKYIYNTLKCIAENHYPAEKYEIVLINNNSTDQTENECFRFQKDFSEVPFFYCMETNQGLSHARNRGIEKAKGDILVFLDDDSFIGKDYLKQLDGYLNNYPDLSAFGGKIIPLYETGFTPKWISRWTLSWVSGIDLGEEVKLFSNGRYPIGANMGIKKSSIESIGKFNTNLGRSKKNLMAGEEKDLFDRISTNGGLIYYFPNIVVQHVIPETRTTKEYVKRLGDGIGRSEKIRTLNISNTAYLKRLFSEFVKWCASIILCLGYVLMLAPKKGTILLTFRWNVTKGLLK